MCACFPVSSHVWLIIFLSARRTHHHSDETSQWIGLESCNWSFAMTFTNSDCHCVAVVMVNCYQHCKCAHASQSVANFWLVFFLSARRIDHHKDETLHLLGLNAAVDTWQASFAMTFTNLDSHCVSVAMTCC